MKTFYRVLIIAIIGIAAGFINGWLSFQGFWEHFLLGLSAAPWYVNLIYVFLAIFLVILVHELGHLFSFLRHDIKIKAFYVLCFVFVKINGKWKFKFFPKFFTLMGGLVAADLPPVRNVEDEVKLVSILKRVLLAGPNMSIYYCIGIVVLYFIMLITPLYLVTGMLFYLSISTILLTLIVIKASRLSYQGLYGDYVAEKNIGSNERFTIAYLISAMTYSTHEKESSPYLWNRTLLELDKGLRLSNPHSISLILYYLHQVVFEGEIGCVGINDKLMKLLDRLPKTEDGFILYQYLIYLAYIEQGLDSALELLEKQKDLLFKVEQPVKLYWEIYTNHALKLVDGSAYLLNPKLQDSSSNAWIYLPFELPVELPVIK